jgi:hypothetical protein
MPHSEKEPMTSTRQTSSWLYRISQTVLLVKLYTRTYPFVTSCIAAFFVFVMFLVFVQSFRSPVERNRLQTDYSKIDMHYNFKGAKIDHWCLWGGDDKCVCDDFNDPIDRSGTKDWSKVHQENIDRIDVKTSYDVVFYGDNLVEGWNGQHLGMPINSIPRGQDAQIQQYFESNFTKANGGKFNGVALGITGDVVRSLSDRRLPTSVV